MSTTEKDPRYPIGHFREQPFSDTWKRQWINDIRNLPAILEQVVQNMDEAQLETPYRDGGWTVKQLVHHVADSHMNAYIRFKLGLTEINPTIKPYDEHAWSQLADTNTTPVNISLTLLHALHRRWVAILTEMTDEDFDKTIIHPDKSKPITLWNMLGTYSWHGNHHVAHITTLKEQKNW